MRGMAAAAFLVGMMGTAALGPGDNASDRAAIQHVLDAHGNAWSEGDAVTAASVMTEDADWVSGGGDV